VRTGGAFVSMAHSEPERKRNARLRSAAMFPGTMAAVNVLSLTWLLAFDREAVILAALISLGGAAVVVAIGAFVLFARERRRRSD
jgi:hypothetical protein